MPLLDADDKLHLYDAVQLCVTIYKIVSLIRSRRSVINLQKCYLSKVHTNLTFPDVGMWFTQKVRILKLNEAVRSYTV